MKTASLILTGLLWLVLPGSVSAQESLDDLLRAVEQAAETEARIDQLRLREFQRQRADQQQLLEQAREELRAEQQRSNRLNEQFDRNERELAEAAEVLADRMGNLGELFGVVRQVSGDVRSALNDSLVSAQFPGRAELYRDLAESSDTDLPDAAQLRAMWIGMMREVVESGRVVEFQADVIAADGQKQSSRDVVRIGVFNAVSDGKFLQWDSAQRHLLELPRQPASRFRSLAKGLQQAAPGTIRDMAVDFTRGDILSRVVRAPDLRDRIRQAGTIGMIIIALGLAGLLFSIWKGIVLFRHGHAIRRQMQTREPSRDNALGRVMSVHADQGEVDVDTLELKLDEAILRETSPLETGLPIIKVLYVIAPLLGLLGTVIGMIVTFQQITMFGTGDPRMMAGGISMALMTTVLGLCVAIPLTVIHSLLQSRSRALIQILEQQAAGIIARTAEQAHGRAN